MGGPPKLWIFGVCGWAGLLGPKTSINHPNASRDFGNRVEGLGSWGLKFRV